MLLLPWRGVAPRGAVVASWALFFLCLRVITLQLGWLPVTTPFPHRRLEQRDRLATGRAPPPTAGSTWGRAAPRLVEGCGARARDGARVRAAREQHTAHRRVTWLGLGLEMGLGVGIG